MTVAKFGGSLLSGGEGVARVAEEILRLGKPVLVVVSAFAGVTNVLERVATTALTDRRAALAIVDELFAMHASAAADCLALEERNAWKEGIRPLRERLEEVVRGLSIVRELSGRTLDLVVSFGERLSSSLVHAAVRASLPEARCISAADLVITDGAHRYARPDLALTRERVERMLLPALLGDGVVITEGYIARSTSGELTTMGRESSDYTATMLGEMIGAEVVRVYGRVPGIMTADPAIVSNARVIPRMSYASAHVLAELGARILHARSVTPVERSDIPLIISTIAATGTTVSNVSDGIGSVALLRDAERVSIDLATAGSPIEPFVQELSRGVPVVWYQRFRRRLEVFTAGPLEGVDLPLWTLTETPIAAERRSVSLVSVVTDALPGATEIAAWLSCLGGLDLLGLHGGVDPRAVTFVVERMDAVDAVNRLHSALEGRGGE